MSGAIVAMRRNRETLFRSDHPDHLALGIAVHRGKLYWTSKAGIYKSDLDGRNRSRLQRSSSWLSGGYNSISFHCDKMYVGLDGNILASDYTAPMADDPAFTFGYGDFRSLYGAWVAWLSVHDGWIYHVSDISGWLSRVGVDGDAAHGGKETLFDTDAKHFVLHSEGKVYWADTESNSIVRADADGSNREVLIGLQYSPSGIALAP